MEKVFIDADHGIYGRVCSLAAKKALEGHMVIVVNSEKVIITGNSADIIENFSERRKYGRAHSLKGPRISRVAFKMLKRGIRGMLPDHKAGIGKQALARIRCYNGVPDEFKNEKMITLPEHKIKYMTLDELSQRI